MIYLLTLVLKHATKSYTKPLAINKIKMKKTLPFILFVISLSMANLQAQCSYASKVQEFKNKANSVGTKKASNGSQGYLAVRKLLC